tara:strand:+ start:1002 stop:1319 length:318 start_codon:yes stop_codon:yes gene_type:complete
MRKGWKRIHRLVVLPDYQGIGIGVKFINEVSKHYKDKGWNVNLTTTTPSLIHVLSRGKDWLLKRVGRVKNTLAKNMVKYYGDEKRRKDKGLGNSENRVTYSFNFK